MFKFEKNIGEKDKKARVSAAIVLLLASFFISGVVGSVMAALAVILIVTAFLKFCPAYTLMGQNTCCGGACKAKTADDDTSDKPAE